MALGVIVSIVFLQRSARRLAITHWLDAFLVVIAGGLIGGRVGFIVWHWDYFRENPPEMWQFWQGGLSYHAALLAGIIALAVWSLLHRQPLRYYAAFFAPAFVLITAFGWVACWLEGCAYGRETLLGVLATDLPDDYGVFAVRYRTQLLGFLLTLAVLIFVFRVQKDQPRPIDFCWTLAAVSLVHFLISLLRGDPTVFIGNMRLDTFFNGLLVFISLLLLLKYVHVKQKI